MPFIYKITNDINEKKYIGKTYFTIQDRWKTHLADFKQHPDRPLYRAMKKYGIAHFHIESIEECSIEQINEREQYWIKEYNTYYSGYNATLGGEGSLQYDPEIFLALYQQGFFVKDIANQINCDIETVRRALRIYGINPKEDYLKYAKEHYGKKCRGIKDDISLEFISMMDAARYIKNQGISNSKLYGIQYNINRVCNGKRKTAYGYKWELI